MTPRLLNRLALALSGGGIFVAGYQSLAHLSNLAAICSAGSQCDKVTTSVYGSVGGIPVSLIGVAGYLLLLFFAIIRTAVTGEKWAKFALYGLGVSAFGFVASAWYMYVSFGILQARCDWCIASAVLMTSLFGVHLAMRGQAAEGKDEWGPQLSIGVMLFALVGVMVMVANSGLRMMNEPVQMTMTQAEVETLFPADSKFKGSKDAPVVLIEFLDVNCSVCRRRYAEFRQLTSAFGDRMGVGFRHFPIPEIQGHETSLQAAVALEYAAAQGKFWEMLDALMAPVNDTAVRSVDGIVSIGAGIGLDRDDLKLLMEQQPPKEIQDAIMGDVTLGQQIQVQGTPWYILVAEKQNPVAVTAGQLAETLTKEPYAGLLRR